MLNKPPIDKVAALAFLQWHLQKPKLPIKGFWRLNTYSADRMDFWKMSGILPIDIGDEKYHRPENAVGSATEFIMKSLGIRLRPVEERLVAMLERNNRTGELKAHHLSLAWLIREMYELPQFASDEGMREVIEAMTHVIQMWLWSEDQGEHPAHPARTVEALMEALPDLVEKTKKCNWAPFTIGRYLRDCWQFGYTEEEVRSWASYWLEGHRKVMEVLAAAEREFSAMPRDEFPLVNVPGAVGLYLLTDNSFLVKVAARKYAAVIARTTRGNTAYMTKQLDVTELYENLAKREADQWHHSGSHVMNGGRIYTHMPPTRGTREGLISLAQRWIKPLRPARRR